MLLTSFVTSVDQREVSPLKSEPQIKIEQFLNFDDHFPSSMDLIFMTLIYYTG